MFFKDSEITLEAFQSLDYYGIADIVKNQSDRALFWKRFRAEYIDQVSLQQKILDSMFLK